MIADSASSIRWIVLVGFLETLLTGFSVLLWDSWSRPLHILAKWFFTLHLLHFFPWARHSRKLWFVSQYLHCFTVSTHVKSGFFPLCLTACTEVSISPSIFFSWSLAVSATLIMSKAVLRVRAFSRSSRFLTSWLLFPMTSLSRISSSHRAP